MPRGAQRLASELGSVLQFELRDVIEKLNRMTRILDGLSLGIDPAKQRRFDSLTPLRSYDQSGDVSIVWTHGASTATEEFDFCHSFVIDFALHIELNH